MALSVIQNPAICSLAQSPIAFAVSESAQVINSASFQYNADLFYWTGGPNASGSAKYTLVKYPNSEDVGIFDFSRILNSTLIDSRQENSSNVVYYTADFYNTYASASISTGTTTIVSGPRTRVSTYKALDGYALFQEPIGQEIDEKTAFWPIMTDGTITQSVLIENTGTFGVYTGVSGEGVQPNEVWYTIGDGIYDVEIIVSSSVSSSQQIQQVPAFPSEEGFPIAGFETSADYYSIQAYYRPSPEEDAIPISDSIRFNLVCNQKYPNVRIKWKNRFGQFDYFNFNMVSRNSFSTTNRSYQPQLGTFEGRTLGYNNYDSSNLNYVVDSNQSLEVNTDWVNDDFNDILKQLLVSDEIYWVYDEANNDLRPITIATNSVTFKTGVVDKKIQYALTFNYGQGYKLIL